MSTSGADFEPTTWTGATRKKWLSTLPPDKLLPEEQPAYVASWIYVFGMLTIVSLIIVLVSGTLLTLGGIQWFHTSSLGHFTQQPALLERAAVLRLHDRALLRQVLDVRLARQAGLDLGHRLVAFVASLGTAFTGYTVTTNFNSQWIAFEAKDVLNSVGIGSWMNVTNLGQMVLFHVVLLRDRRAGHRGAARSSGAQARRRTTAGCDRSRGDRARRG